MTQALSSLPHSRRKRSNETNLSDGRNLPWIDQQHCRGAVRRRKQTRLCYCMTMVHAVNVESNKA